MSRRPDTAATLHVARLRDRGRPKTPRHFAKCAVRRVEMTLIIRALSVTHVHTRDFEIFSFKKKVIIKKPNLFKNRKFKKKHYTEKPKQK